MGRKIEIWNKGISLTAAALTGLLLAGCGQAWPAEASKEETKETAPQAGQTGEAQASWQAEDSLFTFGLMDLNSVVLAKTTYFQALKEI